MEIDSDLVPQFKNLSPSDPEFTKKCTGLVHELISGKTTIVELVGQLGPLLVDSSPTNRELGTWVLSHVLDGLPPNHFDETQLKFICTFYADRLKDHHQVVPAVFVGILALGRFEQIPEGAPSQILRALFDNVSCQQQQEQDRYRIYKIFQLFLERFSTEVTKMGLDFVYGVIGAVDGERNPKNLIFLFNWFPYFFQKVELGHLAEEAFEVLACYFPVDFKTPTRDPNNITRQQLADSLAPCLTSIPQFAQFCLPLALEKLDSSLEIAKLDALKLIETGCMSFDVGHYIDYATQMWTQIQKDVFQGTSPLVEKACLETLTAVIKKLSSGNTVSDICDTLKGNLIMDSKVFQPSVKLLHSVANACKVSCDIVTKEVAPLLINTYNITTTITHKGTLLQILVTFFTTYMSFHDSIELEDLDQIPVICLKASIDNSDLSKVGFDGLSHICGYLPEPVRLTLYENLKNLLLVPHEKNLRESILTCFATLAQTYPNEVKIYIVDKVEPCNMLYLDSLRVIVPLDYFTEVIIDLLIGHLSEISINCLKDILKEYENHSRINSVLNDRKVVTILTDHVIKSPTDVTTLQNVAFIVKSLIGSLPTDRQGEIMKQLPKLSNVFLLDGALSRLRPEVDINYDVLNDLTTIVINDNDNVVKDTAVQLLANLLNKCPEDTLRSYLSQVNTTDLRLLTWITKALVMRNHESACCYTDKLIHLLGCDDKTAVSFRVIMKNYECLSIKSHSNVAFLYQQKFFTIVSNKLCNNPCSTKAHFLAIGYLLEFAPKTAILLQFKKIFKLVIMCLDSCDESDVLTVILQILRGFIVGKEKCIEEHLSDFIARFLKLSTFDKSMKVRILALQCLQDVTQCFPVYELLGHKQEVLAVLAKVIDDKKRMVRREAVEARSLWYLLDAPL